MNFVDAAVALLREAEAPLHVEELCRLALERDLLDSPGANPLRSFKGRLTTELKRGDESRVVRVEDDLWTLSDVGRDGGGEVRPDEGEAELEEDAFLADEEIHEEAGLDEAAADMDQDVDEQPAEERLEEGAPEERRVLSQEEAELVAVYGDEVGTAQVGALSEYRDHLVDVQRDA